ncbi:hypothetical protein EV702DRAFT_1043258 [Suillus placidus]|uniref:26S proteasome regulatory subunit Rpn6 N-terminal domain-containing protein n=1 Tax=Suillus placidus TaxID=48579 RepID=A0A9P7D5H5_9AGAM|nr:hypothetical protein EV702DRAFT_1043258 [Suillus placidus]
MYYTIPIKAILGFFNPCLVSYTALKSEKISEYLEANYMPDFGTEAAAAPRAPNQIEIFIRWCADFCTRAFNHIKSVVWRCCNDLTTSSTCITATQSNPCTQLFDLTLTDLLVVRTLLNYFNSIPNSQQTQIDVLTHSIQWSKRESNLEHCSTSRVASTVALPEGLTSLLSVKPGESQIGFDNVQHYRETVLLDN